MENEELARILVNIALNIAEKAMETKMLNDMPVKLLKPKYKMIEVVIDKDGRFDYSVRKMKWTAFKEKYGDWLIESMRDYKDTHTTSLIIRERK